MDSNQDRFEARRSAPLAAWLSSLLGVVCAAVVAAFVRWSGWWPHADMRQTGVTVFGFIAAGVGVVALMHAFGRGTPLRCVLLLLGVAAALALGATVGFGMMANATEWAK